MTQVTIGARITEDGAEFFGTEELNALIAQGLRVTQVLPERVLMEDVPEEEGAYAVAGFEMTVSLTGDGGG